MPRLVAVLALLALAAPAAAPAAQDADPVPQLRGRAATIEARTRFFGAANVDRRTGAVRRDRVILSWFGVSSFAMAIDGRVVLLDAWVPRGQSVRVLPGIEVTALEHLHSEQTPADGRNEPVPLVPSDNARRFPPRPEDAAGVQRHLGDAMGGAVLYRFRVRGFSLVWHDSVGPLVDRAPAVLRTLRRLGPVDVQAGAIQGFNQFTNGLRDPRTYIEALRPRTFVPNHHDDWFPPTLSMPAANHLPYLRRQLARIPAARRPALRFLRDRSDYVSPELLTFPVGRRA